MERERDHHPERNTRVGSDNVVVRDRGDHHHHASLREYPSVRGLRDRGTAGGGIMLGNEMLELIGRAGSAGGSDSGGESGSGAFDLGGGGGMYCKYSELNLFCVFLFLMLYFYVAIKKLVVMATTRSK